MSQMRINEVSCLRWGFATDEFINEVINEVFSEVIDEIITDFKVIDEIIDEVMNEITSKVIWLDENKWNEKFEMRFLYLQMNLLMRSSMRFMVKS